MLFKNAFHLLVDNFILNYKFLLYRLVVALITLALMAALVYPTVNMLLTGQPFKDLVTLIGEFFRAIATGDTVFLQGFSEQLKQAMADFAVYIGEKTPNLVYFCVIIVLIALVSKFLGGMGNFAFGCLVDNKMSSYAKTSFCSAFISNMGRAALWHLVYVPLTFVYDVFTLLLCGVVFLILMGIISSGLVAALAALMVSVALLLAAQAVKLTLFNDAVPAFVTDKMRLRDAFRKSFTFTKERFGRLFSTYLVTCLLILCLNVLFAVCTFGAGLLITIPMSYLMMICIQFVSYYIYGKRKYFLGEDKIILPKEKTNENFYDDFEV